MRPLSACLPSIPFSLSCLSDRRCCFDVQVSAVLVNNILYSMWKNLSPKIYRKRLIIEGKPSVIVDKKRIDNYLKRLSKLLKMTLVAGPLTRENPKYGLSSYIYWEESGTHLYYWHKPFPFVSVDIYTCRRD